MVTNDAIGLLMLTEEIVFSSVSFFFVYLHFQTHAQKRANR